MNEELLKPCPFCGEKTETMVCNRDCETITTGCTNEKRVITPGITFVTAKRLFKRWKARLADER